MSVISVPEIDLYFIDTAPANMCIAYLGVS